MRLLVKMVTKNRGKKYRKAIKSLRRIACMTLFKRRANHHFYAANTARIFLQSTLKENDLAKVEICSDIQIVRSFIYKVLLIQKWWKQKMITIQKNINGLLYRWNTMEPEVLDKINHVPIPKRPIENKNLVRMKQYLENQEIVKQNCRKENSSEQHTREVQISFFQD